MRIAVVGAGGFVGSRLVKRLRAMGHEVTGHDRSAGVGRHRAAAHHQDPARRHR
ncbi:NAD-dependent epimerase/dehydratase family protein [Streptomyces sp. NPDC001009]